MKKFILFFAIFIISDLLSAQTVSTFDNLTLAPDTFWNGSDLSGGFSSGNAYFENVYDTSLGGYWSYGFAYSDKTDSVTAGFSNEYSAITAGGYNGSANYAIAYDAGPGEGDPKLRLTSVAGGKVVSGFYITNSTYAYLSMRYGDQYEHQFGGTTGDTADWFELSVRGWYNGALLADSVAYYLADFRSPDSTQHYIINSWQWVSLRSLGYVDSLIFTLYSSQTGSFGILTPAYFCMDNLTTASLADINVTINYEEDTIINVLANSIDTTGGPFTVQIVYGPVIPGASALVDSAQNIYYIPTISVEAVDTITYVICDTSGNCDTGQIFINVQPLVQGIKGTGLNSVSVFPNPFTNNLSIKTNENLQEIDLYDAAGRLVIRKTAISNQSSVDLDGTALSPGIYMLKMLSASGSSFAKVIKE